MNRISLEFIEKKIPIHISSEAQLGHVLVVIALLSGLKETSTPLESRRLFGPMAGPEIGYIAAKDVALTAAADRVNSDRYVLLVPEQPVSHAERIAAL